MQGFIVNAMTDPGFPYLVKQLIQFSAGSFRNQMHAAILQILDPPGNTNPLRQLQYRIAKTHALHPTFVPGFDLLRRVGVFVLLGTHPKSVQTQQLGHQGQIRGPADSVIGRGRWHQVHLLFD